MKVTRDPWFHIRLHTARLAREWGRVIDLRLTLAAQGGRRAALEVARMTSEKAHAAADAKFCRRAA